MIRCVVALVLLAALPAASHARTVRIVEGTPQAAVSEGCPAPRTCDAHVVEDYRWPTEPGETLVLPYTVSTVDHPNVSHAQLRVAAARAARAWEAGNPAVRFEDRGLSAAIVSDVSPPDGVNTIGFGPIVTNPLAVAAASLRYRSDNQQMTEFDVVLSVASAWSSAPCEQADGACAGAGGFDLMPGTTFAAVESGLTHELGHVLSLGHPPADVSPALTMHEVLVSGQDRRVPQTLGLGDVLGVRAAYPCGECGGAPRVFAP